METITKEELLIIRENSPGILEAGSVVKFADSIAAKKGQKAEYKKSFVVNGLLEHFFILTN